MKPDQSIKGAIAMGFSGYLKSFKLFTFWMLKCGHYCLCQKKSKDHFGLEGDEESTMLEDSVSPKK